MNANQYLKITYVYFYNSLSQVISLNFKRKTLQVTKNNHTHKIQYEKKLFKKSSSFLTTHYTPRTPLI